MARKPVLLTGPVVATMAKAIQMLNVGTTHCKVIRTHI